MARTSQALGFEASFATCWGGECICGSSDGLRALLESCGDVQRRMEDCGEYSDRGDEFPALCVRCREVAALCPQVEPLHRRIWTGRYFTPCEWASKAVLHLPGEKAYAFPIAFKRIVARRGLAEGGFERLCGLRPGKRPSTSDGSPMAQPTRRWAASCGSTRRKTKRTK